MSFNDSYSKAVLRASNYYRKASQIELAPVRGGKSGSGNGR